MSKIVLKKLWKYAKKVGEFLKEYAGLFSLLIIFISNFGRPILIVLGISDFDIHIDFERKYYVNQNKTLDINVINKASHPLHCRLQVEVSNAALLKVDYPTKTEFCERKNTFPLTLNFLRKGDTEVCVKIFDPNNKANKAESCYYLQIEER